MSVEKVSQEELYANFKERLQGLINENRQMAQKIKENEATALKLQGALETLEYYNPPLGEEPQETVSAPPEEDSEDVEVGLTD
jgi:predicted nuclease with TOPRIM domain